MSESGGQVLMDEQLVRSRLDAFEANRSFFIQMWLQNPHLAVQAGPRIAQLLTPLPHSSPSKQALP